MVTLLFPFGDQAPQSLAPPPPGGRPSPPQDDFDFIVMSGVLFAAARDALAHNTSPANIKQKYTLGRSWDIF